MTTTHPAITPAAVAGHARTMLDDARTMLAAGHTAAARQMIDTARDLYQHAMHRMAAAGDLSHRYRKDGLEPFHWSGRWRAYVRGPGMLTHTLPRTYAHRQSAQRAAGRYISKLTMGALS